MICNKLNTFSVSEIDANFVYQSSVLTSMVVYRLEGGEKLDFISSTFQKKLKTLKIFMTKINTLKVQKVVA